MAGRSIFILKIGLALTFLGHGVFALLGRTSWISYLMLLGFSHDTSEALLTLIGGLDILVAIGTLTLRTPFIFLWCTLWTLATALIRPLAGESWFEFIERGAFYGVSLFLYLNARTQKKLAEKPIVQPKTH